jgi:hypothetical protein
MARRLLRGPELEKRARELGVSMIGGLDMSAAGTVLEPALQHRVMEAERARREERLWLVALFSAIASAISAAAAWWAVALRK